MSSRSKTLVRVLIFGAVGLAFVVALVAARPFVEPIVVHWLNAERKEDLVKADSNTSHSLVRDQDGRPVHPFRMELAPKVVKSLQVTVGQAGPAGTISLPAQIGTLGYDTDRLYSVRPRFQGEV